MGTVATAMIPEVALSVACLTTISPYLGGVYSVTLDEYGMRLQGRGDDVAHIIDDLGLIRTGRLDNTDDAGNRYESWEGWGPDEFGAVGITLVAVYRDAP